MEKYELALVVKPLLPEDVQTKVIAEVTKAVTKLGGTLSEKEVWGKKHLAYPIKGHQEAYYAFYALELPTGKADALNRALKLMSDVLRFLTVKEDNL